MITLLSFVKNAMLAFALSFTVFGIFVLASSGPIHDLVLNFGLAVFTFLSWGALADIEGKK